MTTFHCPDCNDDELLLHWREPGESGLCRSCAAARRGECKFDTHPNHPEHPCSYTTEKPGAPCRWCAAPVPVHGSPCLNCCQTFDGMTIADIKAVFAADGTFNVTPEVG